MFEGGREWKGGRWREGEKKGGVEGEWVREGSGIVGEGGREGG